MRTLFLRSYLNLPLILTLIISPGFMPFAEALEIAREAELASRIGAPMKVVKNKSAQGGKYLATEKEYEGNVSFSVSIPETGNYVLSARVYAPALASDSFYVAINDEAKQIWQLPLSASFEWATYSRVLTLKKGAHTLHFYGRDRGTGLDSVTLTRAVSEGH